VNEEEKKKKKKPLLSLFTFGKINENPTRGESTMLVAIQCCLFSESVKINIVLAF
jgi:hypothetical protein